ncbi:hypothetical protein BDZ97DRAFT_1796717 [Flammula alnicola]|nr:hypothetical protein BDZ97DRAFT_1796717 [Flammula alnicola]
MSAHDHDSPNLQPTTPKRPTATGSPHTPYRPNSNSDGHRDAEPLSQDRKKAEMFDELYGNFAQSESIIQHIFRGTRKNPQELKKFDKDLDQAMDALINALPQRSEPEPRHYKPLVDLLNRTVEAYNKATNSNRSIFFHVYDKTMGDTINKEHPLKPDILGLLVNVMPNKPLWCDVHWGGEVKSTLVDLMSQAATYARSMFGADDTRLFAPVFVYQHSKQELRVVFFHRGGATSTTPYTLSDRDQLRKFAKDLYVMLESESSSGRDPSRDTRFLCLTKDLLLQIEDVICRRLYIRGSATFVATVKKVPRSIMQKPDARAVPDPPPINRPLRSGVVLGNRVTRSQTKQANAKTEESPAEVQSPPTSRRSERLRDKVLKTNVENKISGKLPAKTPEAASTDTDIDAAMRKSPVVKDDGIEKAFKTLIPLRPAGSISNRDLDALPETFVLKHSWVSSDRTDKTVFGESAGEMGIPDVYLEVVPDKNERYKNTEDFFPSDSEALQGFGELTRDPKISVYTFAGKCRPLEDAKSPKELIEGIAHAILGHNVIWKREWLHRDVSLGNIMLLPECVLRKRHELWNQGLDDKSGKTYCIGIISDGDHAVRWKREASEPRAKQRSGTLPYISRRLLIAWYETLDISSVHLAADDLESFAWTLLFAVLEITKERGIKWTAAEGRWYRDMSDTTTLYDMWTRKHAIIVRLKELIDIDRNNPTAPSFSPIISHFAPLLDEWFDLASTWASKARRFQSTNIPLQDIESFDEECYQSCVALILRYLPNIPDTWPDVPLASGS